MFVPYEISVGLFELCTFLTGDCRFATGFLYNGRVRFVPGSDLKEAVFSFGMVILTLLIPPQIISPPCI